MKKYLLSSLIAGFICVSATTASAYDFSTPYLLAQGGYSFGKSANGDAGIMAIGAGYHMNQWVRADITAGYRGWGKVNMGSDYKKKTDVWSMPLLANMYITYPFYREINIYGMGGLGMSWNKTDSMPHAGGATKSNFAWTAGGGFEYQMRPCISLDLGYRYTDLGKARVRERLGFTGKTKQDMRSHDVVLTMRYYF